MGKNLPIAPVEHPWATIVVLLVAAGLFAESLNKAESVNMKLDATNRYIAHINPQAAGYKNTEVGPLEALALWAISLPLS